MLFNRKPRRGWWDVKLADGEIEQVFARYAAEAIALAEEVGPVALYTVPVRNREKILV